MVLDVVERLRSIASRSGVSALALAVTWAVSNEDITGVIGGALVRRSKWTGGSERRTCTRLRDSRPDRKDRLVAGGVGD